MLLLNQTLDKTDFVTLLFGLIFLLTDIPFKLLASIANLSFLESENTMKLLHLRDSGDHLPLEHVVEFFCLTHHFGNLAI